MSLESSPFLCGPKKSWTQTWNLFLFIYEPEQHGEGGSVALVLGVQIKKLQFLIYIYFFKPVSTLCKRGVRQCCSADAEVWEGKKTLLYLRKINPGLCPPVYHPVIILFMRMAARLQPSAISTPWSPVTSAALSWQSLHPAQRMQGQGLWIFMLTLDKLVPLGFWVSGWNAASVAASWKSGLERVRAELHCWNFKEKLDYWGRSKVGRKVLMR